MPTGIYPRNARLVEHTIMNVAHYINKGQKPHLSRHKKAFDKMQLPFMIKILNKLGIERTSST